MGVLNLGYPWWLVVSVLVVFALLTYYVLGGRVSEGLRVPLAVILAPVCTAAAVAVAVVLTAFLSPRYESPVGPVEQPDRPPPATTPETTRLETTRLETIGPKASPTASPSASPDASPSASSTASPSP